MLRIKRFFLLCVLIANAEACIPICVPPASCIIPQQMIRLSADVYMDYYFDPVFSSSNGIAYRHAGSRMRNIALNERIKSKAFEANARMEYQRYYLYRKGADHTRRINKLKALEASTEMQLQEAQFIRNEMMISDLAIKTDKRISEHKELMLK